MLKWVCNQQKLLSLSRSHKPLILLIGQAGSGTGLSRIIHGIAQSLADEYNVHVLGIDYFEEEIHSKIHLLPNPDKADAFGIVEMLRLVPELKPQLIFIHQDSFKLPLYLYHLKKINYSGRLLMHCALEGKITAPALANIVREIDILVVPTEFAQKEYQRSLIELGLPSLGENIRVIPHGIDNLAFYPIDRIEARKKIFSGDPELQNAFWILNANCHQERKQIPVTLEGFSLFLKKNPVNARLWLHMKQRYYLQDILRIASGLGIQNHVKLSGFEKKISDEELNTIYNACDAGINTSTGEGWGLVAFEHGATGAPQIMPRHSACEELWDGKALFLEIVRSEHDERNFFSKEYTSAGQVAGALEKIFFDKALQKKLSRLAKENFLQPCFQWSTVALQWKNLFSEIFSG